MRQEKRKSIKNLITEKVSIFLLFYTKLVKGSQASWGWASLGQMSYHQIHPQNVFHNRSYDIS